jgi:hypothetical protein
MTPEVRGVVNVYRGHLARYQALQQVTGSTWTDADVAKAMEPHRADAERALYRAGFTREQVAGFLAERPSRWNRARTVSEYMNALMRRGGRS